MTLAQLVNVLYNIVDRIYISMIPDIGFTALTGLGICLPAISIVAAFANLFGMGGAPVLHRTGQVQPCGSRTDYGNSFVMLAATGIVLTCWGILIRKPMLYLFGASDITYPYADSYLTIYLLGNVFVMISLGMNNFINSQGSGARDADRYYRGCPQHHPRSCFYLCVWDGYSGAALATIISQGVSAAWVLRFLTGKKAIYTLKEAASYWMAQESGE